MNREVTEKVVFDRIIQDFNENGRIPTNQELADELGVSIPLLFRRLYKLEAEGHIIVPENRTRGIIVNGYKLYKEADVSDMHEELCLKCGKYSESFLGACEGCRWK